MGIVPSPPRAWVAIAVGITTLLTSFSYVDTWRFPKPRLIGRHKQFTTANRHASRWFPKTRAVALVPRFIWTNRWLYAGIVGFSILMIVLNSIEFSEPRALLLFPIAPILGATMFVREQHPDHQEFLVTNGAGGRQCWWTRQVIVGCLAILLSLILSWASDVIGEFFPVFTITYGLLSLGFGQLISLVVTSPLLAIVVTAIGSILVAAWAAAAQALNVPWFIAALLPAVGLWTASWLRASNWFEKRNHVVDWLRPLGTSIAFAALTYVAFWTYRIYEIPTLTNVASIRQQLDEIYQQAVKDYDADARRVLVDAGERVVREGIDSTELVYSVELGPSYLDVLHGLATGDPPASWQQTRERFDTPPQQTDTELATPEVLEALNAQQICHAQQLYSRDRRYIETLCQAFALAADAATGEGKLDLAQQRYQQALRLAELLGRRSIGYLSIEPSILNGIVVWANHEQQQRQRVEQMLAWLVDFRPHSAKERDATFLAAMARMRHFVRQWPSSGEAHSLNSNWWPAFFARFLPGEKTRAMRLVEWETGTFLEHLPSRRVRDRPGQELEEARVLDTRLQSTTPLLYNTGWWATLSNG